MESGPPPIVQSNYPRPDAQSLERFETLLATFRLSSKIFLGLVVMNIALRIGIPLAAQGNDTAALVGLVLSVVLSAAMVAWGGTKYAAAVGANPTTAALVGAASVVVPCMFLLCISYVQSELIKRLKEYGVRYTFLHFPKKDIEAVRTRLSKPGPAS